MVPLFFSICAFGALLAGAAAEHSSEACQTEDASLLQTLQHRQSETCPGTGVACHGDQCCPGIFATRYKPFPCPNAKEKINKCGHDKPICEEAGVECKMDSDCCWGYCVGQGYCSGQLPSGVGAACTRGVANTCELGLVCKTPQRQDRSLFGSEGICVKAAGLPGPPGLGSACGTNNACAAGLVCSHQGDSPPICLHGYGAKCMQGTRYECAYGLACTADDPKPDLVGGPGTCVIVTDGVGAKCSQGTENPCANGLVCSAKRTSNRKGAPGICLPGKGAVCLQGTENSCAYGLVCTKDVASNLKGAPGTCEGPSTLLSLGASVRGHHARMAEPEFCDPRLTEPVQFCPDGTECRDIEGCEATDERCECPAIASAP